jgi:hypothetical protein
MECNKGGHVCPFIYFILEKYATVFDKYGIGGGGGTLIVVE